MLLKNHCQIRSCGRLEVGWGRGIGLVLRYASIEYCFELVFCKTGFSLDVVFARKHPDSHLRPTSNLPQLRIQGPFSNNMNGKRVQAAILGIGGGSWEGETGSRSNIPGGKNGTGHKKGVSEEPPNRKRIVEASVPPNEASRAFPGSVSGRARDSQKLLHGNAHRLLEHGKRSHNQHNANT